MNIIERYQNGERIFIRANLSGARLSEANLSGANLSGARLSEANLSGARLSEANLSGANLSWAKLSGANLSEANLSWANLSGADLSRANLSGANLSGANLSEANLSWAKLSGANLSGAEGVICMIFDKRGYNLVQWSNNDNIRMYNSGCRCFTFEEALAHWGAHDYLNAQRGALYVSAVKWLDSLP